MHKVLGGVALLIVLYSFGSNFAAFGRPGAAARAACEASGGRMVSPMATLGALFAGTVPPPRCLPGEDAGPDQDR